MDQSSGGGTLPKTRPIPGKPCWTFCPHMCIGSMEALERSCVMHNDCSMFTSLFELDLVLEYMCTDTLDFWLYINVRFIALTIMILQCVALGIMTAVCL
mmetsp:Transcript_53939/g.161436  ORF Transcript_53939/g.161436 Transcript_53939/m.161436 type:complete len:99 (-) Transcript_53939:2464-2760(-)